MAEALSQHLPQIADRIHAATHFLLCLDFDGTLAPIVSNPADAQIPPDIGSVLEELAARPELTLAVVSGRALLDLRSRIGFENVILAGNHGLEIAGKGLRMLHPEAEEWAESLRTMYRELVQRTGDIPGSLVEDKDLTLTVHYRNAARSQVPRIEEAVRRTAAPYRDLFQIRTGKEVLEILPSVSWNKGSAIRWILDRLRETYKGDILVCFIGDDVTDELAFGELTDDITIRVGEGQTAARFQVRNLAGVYEFLSWLLWESPHPSATA